MDLHLSAAQALPAERRAIDAAIGPPPEDAARGQLDARGRDPRGLRHLLLPALHAANAACGWISEGAMNYICGRLGVPPAEGFGVASFYAMFSLEARSPSLAYVCDDVACRVRGSEELCAALESGLGPAGAGSSWRRSPCLGLCEQAPAALVTRAGDRPADVPIGSASVPLLRAALAGGGATSRGAAIPQMGAPGLRLLRRVGKVDPERLDAYRAAGGYGALTRALEIGPAAVISEVMASKLVGRGGAAFPTGRKWDAVAKSDVRPRYLVCNADESEPGTFKDRIVMEEDPFAIVEAMTIAGFAIGAGQGYIYVRGEYPLAAARLAGAVAQARAAGLLGPAVMGRGFPFDIEIRRGAGAYICGEETALFNSIEGFRGEPRNKPPFPTEAGLFGKPTVVNNVETLANLLEIVQRGGAAFAALGSGSSTGTKLFCLSGAVRRPGLYEHPFGTTLAEAIEKAGGVPAPRSIQAVLVGGAAGSFLTPSELAMPLTFEGTRAAGASLGSGVVVVFDDTADLAAITLRIAAFFREESCGQCVPCRIGTVRQEEALHRLSRGQPLGSRDDELRVLADLDMVLRDASICGLGQTASSAVQSALKKFGLPGAARP